MVRRERIRQRIHSDVSEPVIPLSEPVAPEVEEKKATRETYLQVRAPNDLARSFEGAVLPSDLLVVITNVIVFEPKRTRGE